MGHRAEMLAKWLREMEEERAGLAWARSRPCGGGVEWAFGPK